MCYRESGGGGVVRVVKMEEKRGCIDPQRTVRYKKRGFGGSGVDFVAVPASLMC